MTSVRVPTLRCFFKYLCENPWRFLHSNIASLMNKDNIWGDLCYEQALDPFNLDEECCVMLFSLLVSKKKRWPFKINFSLSIACYLKSYFEPSLAPNFFIYSFYLLSNSVMLE